MYLKEKKRISGQVFPFLLLGIVALLLAAISARTIWGGNRVKNCADNGADAGSLATGSVLAGGFNDITQRNKAMYDYYQLDLGYYTTLHIAADGYYAEGISNGQTAANEAGNALGNIHGGGCEHWSWLGNASGQNTTAANAAMEAAKCFEAAKILAFYMKAITDNFKVNQQMSYCDINTVIRRAFDTAEVTGKQYAFNNSCISGDGLSNWMGGNGHENGDTYPPGADTSPNACGTTVTINSPAFENIQVEHSIWNYPHIKTFYANAILCLGYDGDEISVDPFNFKAAHLLSQIYRALSAALSGNAGEAQAISDGTSGAYEYDCNCGWCCSDPPLCTSYYDCNCQRCCSMDMAPWQGRTNNLHPIQVCLKDALDNLISYSGNMGGTLTGPNVEANTVAVFENVWGVSGSFFSSTTCVDVKTGDPADESDPYPGLKMTKIDEVRFTPFEWKIDATVDVFCRWTDEWGVLHEGHTVSTSDASFDGTGSVRDFLDDFLTEITDTS